MTNSVELSVRKLVENLILADRVMHRQGLVWGDRYEELRKPIREARAALDARLEKVEEQAALIQSQEAEIARLRAALEFYANDEVYTPDSIGRKLDLTVFARRALTPQPTQEQK